MPGNRIRYCIKIKATEKICDLDFFHASFAAFYDTSSSRGRLSLSSWSASNASIL